MEAMRDEHNDQKRALLCRPTSIERGVVLAQYQKTRQGVVELQDAIKEILKFPQNTESLPRNGGDVKQAIRQLEREINLLQQEIDQL